MAALPCRTRGGGMFFITVAATSKKENSKKLLNLHKILILKNGTL